MENRMEESGRDVQQAITALKKGAQLLKYGCTGKPKFCSFRLSNDEKTLIWFSSKNERQLNLTSVARILPGQRTANFQRYPCPEKECQSFSLIYGYNEQSLDLICKDKDQAELWFVGLKALISGGGITRTRSGGFLLDGNIPPGIFRKNFHAGFNLPGSEISHQDSMDAFCMQFDFGIPVDHSVDKASSVIPYSIDSKRNFHHDSSSIVDSRFSADSDGYLENLKIHTKENNNPDAFRVSSSSVISSSSQGSTGHEENEALGDVYMWGEGIEGGVLGGGSTGGAKMDALLPKQLESAAVLDVQSISCGSQHAALVNRKGETFCWGEESGGRLGHGIDADVGQPQLVEALSSMYTELVACGDYHTCAVTTNGDFYTWGDGTRSFGLLGQGKDSAVHWIPRKVLSPENLRVLSAACGPWHTALVTVSGHLLTFGDGTFGALGHGDRLSLSVPREVDSLKGLKTIKAACGVWHTAAVVEVIIANAGSSTSLSGKVFTWGAGDKGQLGHGDKESRLVPTCVAGLADRDFRQVDCGHILTVALTTSGQVYTMGSALHGQLGNPESDGKLPCRVDGKLREPLVEEIACGAYHVAALTSKAEVYTWGKGANGRLGHGDTADRNTPTLVDALRERQVRSIACGASFTAAICAHTWLSGAEQSLCSGCKLSFGFTRKRHNCYNCGHAFCHACSGKKATNATLSPSPKKPYRVCDPCFMKLKVGAEAAPLKRYSIIPQPFDGKESLEKSENKLAKAEIAPMLQLYDQTKPIEWSPSALIPSISRVPSAPPSAVIGNPGSAVQDSVLIQLKKTNKSLTEELLKMQEQIEALNQRCKSYESGLQFAKNEARQFKSMLLEEKSKCNAVKEAIKSLTMQLNDTPQKSLTQNNVSLSNGMACSVKQMPVSAAEPMGNHSLKIEDQPPSIPTRDAMNLALPPASSSRIIAPTADNTNLKTLSVTPRLPARGDAYSKSATPTLKAYGASVASVASGPSLIRITDNSHAEVFSENPMDPLKAKSSQMLESRDNESSADAEWIEQDEPGVFITFGWLPGGGKDLKRVRFSRKKFRENQAEEWWIENRQRVYMKYNMWGGNANGDGNDVTRDPLHS